MYRYSKNKISVLAVLDRLRAKKSGLFPVKIEVVCGREQKYIPVGLDLSEEEWKSIGSPRLEECRDLWLFSYLCNGINFRDMIYLRYRDIVGDEICFVRSKTRFSARSKPIRAAITPKMLEIIKRTGNPPPDGNPDQ